MNALARVGEWGLAVAILAETQVPHFFVLPRSDTTPSGAFRICIPNREW